MGMTIDQELSEISDLALKIKANYSANLKAEKISMLNKIRAEIESIELLAEYTRGDIKRMALDILDKYKAESEE